MTDIEKLAVELGLVLRNISALQAEKYRLEKEIKEWSEKVQNMCRTSGSTMNDIS
jgi:hypothetical protein